MSAIHEGSMLIRGGTVVLGHEIEQMDLLVRGETIEDVGQLRDAGTATVVDAEGLLVLPGAIDTHVHLNDMFMSTVSVHDYYTGTRAAAFGGVTSIIDFSNQVPGGSLLQTLDDKHTEADGKALIDWGVHPVITRPDDETLDQIPAVVERGSPTIKCYMTYRSDGLLIEDVDLKRIAARLKDAGGMLMFHAEDNDMIERNVPKLIAEGKTASVYHARSKPEDVETEAIRRVVQIVRDTKARMFIVHLASHAGLDLITSARREGLDLSAETCTHYLIFTDTVLEREDGMKWICSPPLRGSETQEALWQGVADGRIRMVTSDDAAYSWEAKMYGADRFDKCPNGIPGIEARFHALYSEGVVPGRITLPRFVEIVSTVPATLFGLAPRTGSLAPGSDADIVLLDPEQRWTMSQDTLHMATDWCAWDGIEITGKIQQVYSRGELVIDGDECVANPGRGRYIHRSLPAEAP